MMQKSSMLPKEQELEHFKNSDPSPTVFFPGVTLTLRLYVYSNRSFEEFKIK